MGYKVLQPEVVLQLLEGRESAIPQMAERDEQIRSEIISQTCPQCGEHLEPIVPSDPKRVFRGTTINYDKRCPEHGLIT
jgi:hypothetical protein